MTGAQKSPLTPGTGFQFPWPFPEKPSTFYKMKSYLTMAFVHSLTRAMFAFGVNKIRVKNRERLLEALRDESRPLITMVNHRSNVDDPLMFGMFSWREFFSLVHRHRYTLTAHNICFTKAWHTTLFSLGRCVPCVRGEGVFQEGMDFCLRRLNERGWVNIFPEGKVTEAPLRFKWGIGRLVLEAKEPPLVLPIWMRGMSSVWPNTPPYYPKFGHVVEVIVGEAIDTQPLVEANRGKEEIHARKAITDSLQDAFFDMAVKCGGISREENERVKALK